MLDSLRTASRSWVAKLMLGLLVLSFAVWGVADVFTSNLSGQAVLTAGKSEVSPTEYRLAYDRQVGLLSQRFGQQLTREQATAIGVNNQVLSQLVAGVLLDEQARNMSLGLSKDRLALLAAEDPAFQGPDGRFSPAAFDNVLRQVGMRPQDYLDNRSQVARRQQIVEAVSDGMNVPDAMLKALALYRGESRTIDYLSIPASIVGEIPAPTDEELKSYFEANIAAYKAPEYRKISYVKLEASDIADPKSVTEDEIKAEYEKNISRHTTPETRTIEQLTFNNLDAARAAHDRIKTGTSFDEIVTAEGKTLADIVLGTFPKAGLPDQSVADAIFSLPEGGVSDVTEGAFGPVLIRVTEITPENIKPFAEVEQSIRDRIALSQASEILINVHDGYEEARAGGETMAEAAQKQQLKVTTIDAVDQEGNAPDGTAVKDIPESARLVAAAFATDEGIENESIHIGTQGFVWYEVDGITPARDRTLDEVRDRVVADWKKVEAGKRLNAKTEELKKRLVDGTSLDVLATEASLEKQTKRGITRQSNDAELGSAAVAAVFDGPQGSIGVADAPSDDSKILFKVTESIEPASAGPETIEPEVKQAYSVRLADDLLDQLVAKLQTEYPVTINQAAIDNALAF
ncbi:MAG: peptidyl-prolyl cis-trans isomerase [Phyllobacterium sp.]